MAWPFGFAGEAAIVAASLTDKARQEKLVHGRLFAVQPERRWAAWWAERADEYRQRIQASWTSGAAACCADRLKTGNQVYDWIANMVALAGTSTNIAPIRLSGLTNVPKTSGD